MAAERDIAAILPESVTVWFPPEGYGCEGWTEEVTLAEAGVEGVAGHPGTVLARTDLPAELPTASGVHGDPPTNQDELRALAERLAKDYYAWRSLAFDRVYAGVARVAQCGLVDEVTWTEREKECTTRARTAPYDWYPDRFHHGGTWGHRDVPAARLACIITQAVGPVTGTSPNFAYGRGKALLLKGDGGGLATTGREVEVCNGLPDAIPAGPALHFLTREGCNLVVDLGPCTTPP